jgi:hypothetical protein
MSPEYVRPLWCAPKARCHQWFSPIIWKRSRLLSLPSTKRSPPFMHKIRSADCWRALRGSESAPLRRSSPGCRTESFQVGARLFRLARIDAALKFQRGKEKLGSISKQGNRYMRRLLVLGATSLLRVVGRRKGALRDWLVPLLARKPA